MEIGKKYCVVATDVFAIGKLDYIDTRSLALVDCDYCLLNDSPLPKKLSYTRKLVIDNKSILHVVVPGRKLDR